MKDEGFHVAGARVEVTSGTGRGLTATTDTEGYVLWGVAGDVEIRVTHDAFQEQRKRVLVTTHQTLDFDLNLTVPRAAISGTYTLTVSAAAECRAALPERARARTYTAVIRQEAARLTATLQGAKFFSSFGQAFDSFQGLVERENVIFQLGSYSYYYPVSYGIIEELDTTTLLAITGGVASTASPTRLAGALNGTVETLRQTSSGSFETIASCPATAHPFVFSR